MEADGGSVVAAGSVVQRSMPANCMIGGNPARAVETLEKAMEALAGDMDSIDENDPKQGAHLMRKLFSATGMPIGAGMAEALKRMESGEDPEKIETAICALLPAAEWGQATHLFIFHGRRTCHAKQPNCPGCSVRSMCPWPEKR